MKALILAGSDTGRRENLAMALREIRKRFPVAAVSHPVRSRPWSGEGDDLLIVEEAVDLGAVDAHTHVEHGRRGGIHLERHV